MAHVPASSRLVKVSQTGSVDQRIKVGGELGRTRQSSILNSFRRDLTKTRLTTYTQLLN